MDNNIDVFEQLKIKNHELYINKLIIDLENAMESLLLFYGNYCDTQKQEMKSKIISFLEDSNDIQQQEVINRIVESFFDLLKQELNKVINERLNIIKNDMQNIDTFNYEQKLSRESTIICNHISDYYQENIYTLIDELKETIKDYQLDLKDYLLTSAYFKIINTLKDKIVYSMKLINNNYDENTTMLQTINEKTINKV